MKGKTCPLHPTKWNHLLLTVLLKIPLNYLFWMGLLLALANRTCCCLNIKQFTARELFCFIRYFQIFTNVVKYWVDIDSLKKKKKKGNHSFILLLLQVSSTKTPPTGRTCKLHTNHYQQPLGFKLYFAVNTFTVILPPKKTKTKQISLQKYVVFE